MLDILLNHAKHFTDPSHEKDVAKVIHFFEDGKVFMTDAVTAILAHNVNPKQENYTLKIDGSKSKIEIYKDYHKFFPSDYPIEIEISVGETLLMTQAFEAVNKAENSNDQGKFRFIVEDRKLCAYYRGSKVNSLYEITDYNHPFERDLTINLITKSMKLLKDLGYETCILKAPEGKLRPILFTVPDGQIEILILPCRIY